MHIYSKPRLYYEDLCDRHTVESGRHNDDFCQKSIKNMKEKLPDEDPGRPGNAFVINIMYMSFVGNDMLNRYNKRESSIAEMMVRDRSKDEQVSSARLTVEPRCQHCGEKGLSIIDKDLMHHGEDYYYGDPEEVLFTLHCPHCEKNSACWEDGSEWEHRHTKCPKCKSIMDEKSRHTKTALNTTYICPKCSHTYKDKLDLSPAKEEKPDPNYEKDRKYYCLEDEDHRKKLQEMRSSLEQMAELGKKFKEKEDNKHIYDAVKDLKKPKIAELTTLLSPVIEKAGYIEFSLDKPELGKDVIVGFNCLDSNSDRKDYDSRETLKKLVDKTLIDTNWRLMSDGISYRLGYLNGRVKAYEGEEAMKELVIKSGKLNTKPKNTNSANKKSAYALKDKDGREIIL